MSYLWLRGKIYWFRMRTPTKYQSVHEPRFLTQSLGTDSLKTAQALAYQVREKLLSELEVKLVMGRSRGDDTRYRATIKLAKENGISPISASDLAKGELEELLSRLSSMFERDPAANSPQFAANLGGFELPDTNLNEIAVQMGELCPDKVAQKNARQKRMWLNRYKRAAKTFSEVVSNKPITKISSADASNYRRDWEKRVANQEVTTQYANKHFGYLRMLVDAYYESLKVDEFENPFENIRIKGEANWEKAKDPTKKAGFSPHWIEQNIINGSKLEGLNEEARDILIVCAETGCRQTEIFDLPPSAIKLAANVPHILIRVEDGEHQREIKNKASRRSVPLVGAALAAMKRHPNGFPRYRGKESFSAAVSKYFAENNLFPTAKHQVSSLRHSFESRMRRAGLSNEERGNMMGHSMKSIRGREVYGDETSLRIRALFAELVSFETPYWKPRNPDEVYDEIDKILLADGFKLVGRR
ncbi:DUF6538 domain-containing protein [Ruegeria arenilitoris]|uniref:Phage integrase family protein n=1 Tax=Ruegeria arenilitoris TaxID=1173585 RepID=A0A238KM80_9RHOB|nr:DUF6538 domain-containing protein [Ruegeria arenilitoris]SMX43885.1 Phage integrase family protein [Ruegeria arenilitoris]